MTYCVQPFLNPTCQIPSKNCVIFDSFDSYLHCSILLGLAKGVRVCCVRGHWQTLRCQWELPIWMCVWFLWFSHNLILYFLSIIWLFWIFWIFLLKSFRFIHGKSSYFIKSVKSSRFMVQSSDLVRISTVKSTDFVGNPQI